MSDQQPWSAGNGDTWRSDRPDTYRRGRDGEVMPWEGGRPVESEGQPTRQADVIVTRYEMNPDNDPYRRPPGDRRRRAVLLLLVALLALALLVIVVLVVTRPAQSSSTSNEASTTPSAAATSLGPSAATSSPTASPAVSTSATTATSAAASTPAAAAPGTIGPTGGGADVQVTDLSALNPVQTYNVQGPNPGPEQIGAITYQNSVGFTCYTGGPSYFDYNVAGYKFLTAVIGVPSNSSNAAGNSLTITFFKDGSSVQLGSPVTVSLDHPQSVHLNLQGSSQLEISCAAISQTTHSSVGMDGALGNATLGPN